MAVWQYGPGHSRIEWTCPFARVFPMRGIFTRADVRLDVEADDPSQWSVEAIIDATSLDSGHAFRDDILRGADYLDVERYPTIRFASRRFEPDGDGFRVAGDLTIHDTTRPVTLALRYLGEAAGRGGERMRGFSADLAVQRADFGVGPPLEQGDAIGHTVDIALTVEVRQREG